MRLESAQDQQDQYLEEQKPKLQSRQQFEALLGEKGEASSPQASSTAYDPLATLLKTNPTLTREKAEAMIRAAGF